MIRKTFVSVGLLIVAVVVGRFANSTWAHEEGEEGGAPINETVHVNAEDPADSGAEGWFRTPPNGNMDQIHVTNPCVKGLEAGPYKDPIDDCADVYLKSADPVIAEVEGRLGVGAMYWVTVKTVPCNGGKGSGPAKDPEILRADVEDMDIDRVLTLWDENSCRHASDETDAVDPLAIVYCSARKPTVEQGDDNGTPKDDPGPKGKVRFQLSGTGGEPEWVWKITNTRTHTAVSGILLEHKNYEETVGSLPPDRYRLEVSCTCEGQMKFKRTIDFTVFSFTIKYPHGDPSKSATDWDNVLSEEANRGNERTFRRGGFPAATKLDVPCEAEVSPADAAQEVKDLLHWTIEDIQDVDDVGAPQLIRATWLPHVTGDVHTGKGLKSEATYLTPRTGLPRLNSAFGSKNVTLTTKDGACEAKRSGVKETTRIEIFFPQKARNHAGGQKGSPNWFHYWMQSRPNPKVEPRDMRLDPRKRLWGLTPAMYRWTYAAPGPGDKGLMLVSTVDFPLIGIPDQPYDVGERLTGIDLLVGLVIHEEMHVMQIAAADALMPASNGQDTFRYGWSWRQPRHNHWKKNEPNGAWGKDDFDDDRNDIKDDAAPVPPFEPGWAGSDDQPLDDGRPGEDWPLHKDWPVPAPFPGHQIPSLEIQAIRHADANMAEDRYWKEDWADPGKQHKTNKDYRD